MKSLRRKLLGPQIPPQDLAANPEKYRLPGYFLIAASILLLASIFLPYWKMTLLAPQYPGGLSVVAYLNRLTGDVREIDGLNHYIGMRPLEEAAQLERSLSIFAVTVISLLVLGAIFVHNQNAAYLSLPAMLFPLIFLGDMYLWMRHFGLNLDPTAALSGAIEPFVPPILGEGSVAQFRTVASLQPGMYLALLASLLILAGLYFHRKTYKPLVDAQANS